MKTPAELAKDAITRAPNDYIFDGSMEGDFDRGYTSFAEFVKGYADAGSPAERWKHPLVVKTHEIAENPTLAAERIGKQLDLGVSTIVFVGVESPDEVKTGLTVAAGGATELFGIRPDLVCLAKALGAGIPTGAIGGTDEVWQPVLDGDVYMVGTFNGNPLAMAAARANLERVMTADAYARLGAINTRLLDGAQGIIDRYRLAAYPIGIESKGVITFASTKVIDYESYKSAQQKELVDLGDHVSVTGQVISSRRGERSPATRSSICSRSC